MITQSELGQFIGTEHHYRHWLGRLVFTDGVKYVADQGGAYWLIDAIASYRRREPFQVWALTVNADKTARLTMREDTGERAMVVQKIKYTDFPLAQIKFYVVDGVLMLPSEY